MVLSQVVHSRQHIRFPHVHEEIQKGLDLLLEVAEHDFLARTSARRAP
jgi:hypothetical protein